MATRRSAIVKSRFWTADWFVGLALTLVFLAALGTRPMVWLEAQAFDWTARFTGEPPDAAGVAVIAIDEESIQRLGPWPWPRDRFAALVESLPAPKAVGAILPLQTPQFFHATQRLQALRETLMEAGGDPESLDQALRELATDTRFAAAVAKTNLVLAVEGRPSSERVPSATEWPALARKWLPPVAAGPGEARAHALAEPYVKVGTGHEMVVPPSARTLPLALLNDGRLEPTFTTAVLARTLGVRPEAVEFTGQSLQVGPLALRTDRGFRVYPRYGADVPVYSFASVLSADSSWRRQLGGRTILLGPTAAELTTQVTLPDGSAVAPVVAVAQAVAGILAGATYTIPEWTLMAQLAAVGIVGLFVALVLPRLRRSTGFVVTLMLLFLLGNAHVVLMSTFATWIPLGGAAALLLAGFVTIALKQLVRDRFDLLRHELSGANRQLGQALHAQGQLDQAFERYRRCSIDESLLEALYSLGLDYERKRWFNKAAGVFAYLESRRPGFRDSAERARRNREMESVVVLGKAGGTTPNGTLIMSAAGLQNPMLGRYQIEKELGRGAMGMVYLGRDPKIGRTVAVKTIALSQEFDDETIGEVRERFFREAETAGQLNHPNIVTIYDAGEEQELAYIAMDYLRGTPLADYCKPDRLLSVAEVLEVAAQVAEALGYAHGHNVVHRDIKPANIIYDQENGIAKVTDFGVACVTDSSKTKTGTILGSPSYMSPEQLAGRRVDGRSDIFSLGTTVFQLLTGQLPFAGDSLATLMYRIANDRHPDIRTLRPDLPACASRLVNKALQKEPERRYQSGAKFAEALRRCKENCR